MLNKKRKPRGYWTIEKLKEEALKYKTKAEFRKANGSAYGIACNREDYKEIVVHMKDVLIYWTFESLKEEALKYKTKGEFVQKNSAAYQAAHRRDDFNKICEHMPEVHDKSGEGNPRFKWTFEKLKKEALKYNTIGEFQKGSNGAYLTAQRRKDSEHFFSHIKTLGGISVPEINLFDSIKKVFPQTKKLRKKKIEIEGKPHIKGFDLDIFVPELNKGIEFDGAYWHSFEGLKRSRKHWPDEDIKNYHEIKDAWFASMGIKVLHIKEKDWNLNQELCIEKCLDFLNKN